MLASHGPGVPSDPVCSCDIYSLNTCGISSHLFLTKPAAFSTAWFSRGFECPVTRRRASQVRRPRGPWRRRAYLFLSRLYVHSSRGCPLSSLLYSTDNWFSHSGHINSSNNSRNSRTLVSLLFHLYYQSASTMLLKRNAWRKTYATSTTRRNKIHSYVIPVIARNTSSASLKSIAYASLID